MSTSPAQLAPSQMGFEKIAVLAVSAMAQVDLCRIVDGEHRGAIVAVKRLPHDVVEDPELREMFQDEIWMAAALDHPNIARVLGWGEDDRGPYLVSEFVHGVPLTRLMRTVFNTGEHFTERLVIFLASCVSGGLSAAHELRGPDGQFLNLVHRELTPGNVLLGFDGSVKITDFGLAKAKQRITYTAVGKTKGDPSYMSPEQVLGRELDGRSDIFALGVLMYELFAKELPWRVRSVRDALSSIVQGPAPDLAAPCPRVDPAIVALVNRCVAKPVDDRHPTVHVLKGELDRWLELHGYAESRDHLARFVRRNAMRQMRWLERLLSGEDSGSYDPRDDPYDKGADAEASSESIVSEVGDPVRRTGPAVMAPGRLAGPDDDTAPPPPPRPAPRSLTNPTTEASTARRPSGTLIDDPETAPEGPRFPQIDDPESAPTTIDRPRPRMGTVTLTTTRARDVEPPMGATMANAVTLAGLRSGDEPATERRGPNHPVPNDPGLNDPGVSGPGLSDPESADPALFVLAARIVDGAEEVGARARAAAEEARASAQRAESAAVEAAHAAEAVQLVHEALRAREEGDRPRSLELLRRANRLLDGVIEPTQP